MGECQSRLEQYRDKRSPYAYRDDELAINEPDDYYNEGVRSELSSQRIIVELNNTTRPPSSRASSQSDTDRSFEIAESGGGGGGGGSGSRPTSNRAKSISRKLRNSLPKLTRRASNSPKTSIINRASPTRTPRRRRASTTDSSGVADNAKPKKTRKNTRKRHASAGDSSGGSSSKSSSGDQASLAENAKVYDNLFAQAAKQAEPVKLTANAKAKNRLTLVQKRAQQLANQPIHMPVVSDTAARTGDTRFKSVRGMIALNPDFPIFRAAPPGTYEDHHPDIVEPDENAYGEARRPVQSTREEVSARIKRIAMGTAQGGGYNPGMATVAFGPQIIQGFKEKRKQKKKLDRMNNGSGGAKVQNRTPRRKSGSGKPRRRRPRTHPNGSGNGAPKTKHMGRGDVMSLL